MTYIDVRGPFPIYIKGNFAIEMRVKVQGSRVVTADRSLTVEEAEHTWQMLHSGNAALK